MVCELARTAGGRVSVESMRKDAIYLISILTQLRACDTVNAWGFLPNQLRSGPGVLKPLRS